MNLAQLIAEEVVKGFSLFKPEKIRFFGFDDWLVRETTKAFYNLRAEVLVWDGKYYRGAWEYDNGLLLPKGDGIYQVNVGEFLKIYKKAYQKNLLIKS